MPITRSMVRRGLADPSFVSLPNERPNRQRRKRRLPDQGPTGHEEGRPAQVPRLDADPEQGQHQPTQQPRPRSAPEERILDFVEPHLSCLICWDWLCGAHKTQCGHIFCGQCIRQAYGHSQRCALCQFEQTRPHPREETTDLLVAYFLLSSQEELARWQTRLGAWEGEIESEGFSWGLEVLPDLNEELSSEEQENQAVHNQDRNDRGIQPERTALGLHNHRV